MMKSHDQEKNSVSVSPQMIQALLRQLVYHAKVPASAITFYDISRYIPDNIYTRCKEEFPDVHFIDGSGQNGREPFSLDTNTEISWSDTLVIGEKTYIPSFVSEADYIISLANLKGHTLAGVTMCAKNHFGTYLSALKSNGPMDAGVHPFIATGDNAPTFGTKRDMGTYNALVDIMGHKHLGEKTLLFMIDALYNTAYQNTQITADYKLNMPPFNGDWMSSLFVSLDGVAIESVGLDFLHNEPGPAGEYVVGNVDNYLHEAAQAGDPPSGTIYDPEGDGTSLISLGVHEHWNDAVNKQYSRNLGEDKGIELQYVDATFVPIDPNPIDTIPIDTIPIDTIPIDTIPIDTLPIDTLPIDTTIIDPTVNISLISSAEIKLYPNPVADIASLAIDGNIMGDITIEVLTISGAIISKNSFIKSSNNQKFNIDLTDLAPGPYICIVSGQGFFEIVRFVKAN